MSNYQFMQNGSVYYGNAVNNTQTDQEVVLDTGNEYISNGGNLQMVSLGGDSATTIDLKGKNTTDTIQLYGSGNTLDNADTLKNATVSFFTYDFGGAADTVNLTNTGGTTSITNYSDNSSITLNGATSTVSAGGSSDKVQLNSTVANTLTTQGSYDTLTVNGDATNVISSNGSNATINVGSYDDDKVGFGHSTKINFSGTGNVITGGDENFTISGGNTAGGYVFLGDGNNSVNVTGTNNSIEVGGGNNTINAGDSNAVVFLAGVDDSGKSTFTPEADDPGLNGTPTDFVTIAGSGDVVFGTYENAIVNGSGVTSNAQVYMGDGNNTVSLGGTGGDVVSLGNGSNTASASGDNNKIYVGSGTNSISLSGNGNTVTVTDPKGIGSDKVQLGTGTGDTVALDHAGGSVTGTGTGTTTVTQSGKNSVTVDLGNGTGLVTLGDGNDKVTANGDKSVITAGNGNDTVKANGNNDQITLGNGNDTVTANGNKDTMKLGSGTNTVTANGNNDTLSDTGGTLSFSGKGLGDTLNLSGTSNSSKIVDTGNNETFNLSNGAGGAFTLGGAAQGDAFVFSPTSGKYSGAVTVSNFQVGDTMNLAGLTDTSGWVFDSTHTAAQNFHELLLDLAANNSGGSEALNLKGGGSITFVATTGFNASEFKFA